MIPVMSGDLFDRYQHDPLKADADVRRIFKVPDNRYYSVTIWPDHMAGRISIDMKRTRAVAGKKISKSDQG